MSYTKALYTSLLLFIFLSILNVVSAGQFIYNPGDWFRYRAELRSEFGDRVGRCIVDFDVSILSIRDGEVKYRVTIIESSGDVDICRYIEPFMDTREEVVYPIGEQPDTLKLLIDPSISGIFNCSRGQEMICTVRYERGVLMNLYLNTTVLFTKFNMDMRLIDTSVMSLKILPYIPWLILGSIVVVLVILLKLISRRPKTHTSSSISREETEMKQRSQV